MKVYCRKLKWRQAEEGGEYVKCPHCGNDRVIESDNFCGKCGRKLKLYLIRY